MVLTAPEKPSGTAPEPVGMNDVPVRCMGRTARRLSIKGEGNAHPMSPRHLRDPRTSGCYEHRILVEARHLPTERFTWSH